jgi:recombinational DNA repair protein RecT
MAQLADRVGQVERLKAEKARTSKFSKKEKFDYVNTNDNDP